MAIETKLTAPIMLIAVPRLGDPNFRRTLVLVLEHNASGSMGLTINRPSSLPMGAFCASQSMDFRGDHAQRVYQGGPVQTDRAFILHASSHRGPETEDVADGVCLSYSLESLRMLANLPPERMRVFLGYAGWGPNQLAVEVSSGSWLIATPSQALLLGTAADQQWESALSREGITPMQLVHSGSLN